MVPFSRYEEEKVPDGGGLRRHYDCFDGGDSDER